MRYRITIKPGAGVGAAIVDKVAFNCIDAEVLGVAAGCGHDAASLLFDLQRLGWRYCSCVTASGLLITIEVEKGVDSYA